MYGVKADFPFEYYSWEVLLISALFEVFDDW